uniref:heme attachment to plastid cytochrome c n=1 Tax=Polulichloris maxima TaxID=2704661 RepID=UPI002410BA03|nr:heme attachment to plastid cytochrome c [Polulichloris maxima]WDY13272.1 heme attachment to plastid cytochrome c [Polulichloris maxima]
MNFSPLHHYLMPIAFTLLLLLMLLYWAEAVFFGFEPFAPTVNSNDVSKNFILSSKSTIQKSSVNFKNSVPSYNSSKSNSSKEDFFLPANRKTSFLDDILCFVLRKPKTNFQFVRLNQNGTKSSWQEKYKIFTHFIFLLSILSLTVLITFRWVESGHFPLSNLYESLLFLSWCFLSLKIVFLADISPYKSKKDVFNFALNTPTRESRFSHLGLGVILSPLSLLTFGFAFLSLPKEMQQSTSLVPALQSNWLMMHVTVMVLSYAALLAGSILAIAYLIVNRFYKNKNNGSEEQACESQSKDLKTSTIQNRRCLPETDVPSFAPEVQVFTSGARFALAKQRNLVTVEDFNFCTLNASEEINTSTNRTSSSTELLKSETLYEQANTMQFHLSDRLDNLSYRILALGFPLLTIGILSGAVWANEAWGSYWSWDPKETWALITWLVFAIYLHTRITKGWSGEKPAIVASVGFFIVWFCYLGVNLLGNGLHSYGWFSN